MSSTDRRFLREQILEMDRLLAGSEDDPIMGFALRQRKAQFSQQLSATPISPPKPRTVLFFAGRPVRGSTGIDAQFAAQSLTPFLEAVKTQYSAQKYGRVGQRGPRKDESEARMLLTSLPRGSFGLELSQPDSEDFISSQQLSDTLVRLTELIAAAGDSDEHFAVSLDKVSPRVLPRLGEFLETVAQGGAWLRVESGDISVELPKEKVEKASERVLATKTDERIIEGVRGEFRGATLESWRFDFKRDDGVVLSGRLGEELEGSEAAKMIALTGRTTLAKLRETSVSTREGSVRYRFELLGLDPA
jgi:hypothetical protein